MIIMDLKFGIIFLFQIVIGTFGNFFLLHYYFSLYFSGGCRLRFTDVVLRHLTMANSLVILSRGIPEIMVAFGAKGFLDDVGCKFVFYLHRVGRGVSMDTTCLLSVFQAMTISPRDSIWAELKKRVLKYLGPSNILCWILHMLLNIRVSMLLVGKRDNKNFSKTMEFQYCSVTLPEKDTGTIFAAYALFHDILCLKLMVLTSGSMVFTLYRHKQRVSHIHSHEATSRPSPETRASLSVLALVSTFLLLYTLSSTIHGWFFLYDKTAWWLVNIAALTNSGFPTVSPFILLSRERGIFMLVWKK